VDLFIDLFVAKWFGYALC